MLDDKVIGHKLTLNGEEEEEEECGRKRGRVEDGTPWGKQEKWRGWKEEVWGAAKSMGVRKPKKLIDLFTSFHFGGSRVGPGDDLRIIWRKRPDSIPITDALHSETEQFLMQLEWVATFEEKDGPSLWLAMGPYRSMQSGGASKRAHTCLYSSEMRATSGSLEERCDGCGGWHERVERGICLQSMAQEELHGWKG